MLHNDCTIEDLTKKLNVIYKIEMLQASTHEKRKKVNTNRMETHYNLGILLTEQCNDVGWAIHNFDQVIRFFKAKSESSKPPYLPDVYKRRAQFQNIL